MTSTSVMTTTTLRRSNLRQNYHAQGALASRRRPLIDITYGKIGAKLATPYKNDNKDLLDQANSPSANEPSEYEQDLKKNNMFDQEDDAKARFKIAQGDKNLAGGASNFRNSSRLEIDPESFKNEVSIYIASQKRKRLFSILGFVCIAFVFAWGINTSFPKNKLDTNAPPSASADVSETQRFLALYPQAPQPNVDQMALLVEGQTVKTAIGGGLGATLQFEELAFSKSGECKVSQVTDFGRCLTTNPEDPFDGTLVWLTKDAVRSSLFSKATNFTETYVSGAITAAVMILPGLTPEPRATLVIVSPDVTGYIITLPADATLADAKALAETVTVK